MGKQKRGKRNPRGARTKKGEKVFVFDRGLTVCHGEAEGLAWDEAIVAAKGNVVAAAELVGIEGASKGAKALWGRNEAEARAIYDNYKASRAKKKAAEDEA